MGNSGGDGGERDGQGVGVGQSGSGGIGGDLKLGEGCEGRDSIVPFYIIYSLRLHLNNHRQIDVKVV